MASEIPVIDIDRDPDAVGRDFDETLRAVGFFQITNHGVDPSVAEACWTATRAFFDLPLDDKLAVGTTEGGLYGYFPMRAEALAASREGTGTPDLKESLNSGPFDPPRHPPVDDVERALFASIEWPPALPELREAWRDYFGAMQQLADRLMSLFARGLDLPADYFAAMIDDSASALRAIDYPAQRAAPPDGALRAGAHTDYGTLTILRQQAHRGGLEVFDETGRAGGEPGAWLEVPAIDGALVINIGDLMARWTNDRWTSTLHRVVATDLTTRRQSMPFFHNANYSQVIECLPSCVGDGAKYEPVLAGPHLAGKTMKATAGTAPPRG